MRKDRYLSSGENKTLVEQLDELREQLNTIDNIYQTVDVTANDARDTTEEGLTSIDEAEKILDKIHEQLTVNKIYYS
jgi:methyl-accepting chemotaxis protein